MFGLLIGSEEWRRALKSGQPLAYPSLTRRRFLLQDQFVPFCPFLVDACYSMVTGFALRSVQPFAYPQRDAAEDFAARPILFVFVHFLSILVIHWPLSAAG
jgi:hypothetical protein